MSFQTGDRCRVVSDKAGFGHGIDSGLVELVRFDKTDDSWLTQDGRGQHWVGVVDLEPAETEEALDEEARRLFGISPVGVYLVEIDHNSQFIAATPEAAKRLALSMVDDYFGRPITWAKPDRKTDYWEGRYHDGPNPTGRVTITAMEVLT